MGIGIQKLFYVCIPIIGLWLWDDLRQLPHSTTKPNHYLSKISSSTASFDQNQAQNLPKTQLINLEKPVFVKIAPEQSQIHFANTIQENITTQREHL